MLQSNTKAQTRQLTVNAAFLKEIKDDNKQLKQIWDQIIPIADRTETASNHWRELIGLFAELRDQLALHFSLEEAYGYFDDAVDAAPQLSTIAECLRSEHPDLFAQIRDLADGAAEIRSDRTEEIEDYVHLFQKFRKQFEAHEEAELKLILEALDDDIGVGD